MSKIIKNKQENSDPIASRLDVLIRLQLIKEFSDEKKKFKLGEAVKFLSSCELEPNEIAKLVGKKKVTDISIYLYSKKQD